MVKKLPATFPQIAPSIDWDKGFSEINPRFINRSRITIANVFFEYAVGFIPMSKRIVSSLAYYSYNALSRFSVLFPLGGHPKPAIKGHFKTGQR